MNSLGGGSRYQARQNCPDGVQRLIQPSSLPIRDAAGHARDAPIIIDTTTDASESTDADSADFLQMSLSTQASDTRYIRHRVWMITLPSPPLAPLPTE
ncbi:unnamed protein product [Penicillium egyptiacum]|uniref:Uncharacterized protein n=1 Tax=Penicillium egyptiacum TaxID=1303716 RepID=A0A9W4P8D3_9EURO|nr:unnamed protein product [Penicillium egyptiacum]